MVDDELSEKELAEKYEKALESHDYDAAVAFATAGVNLNIRRFGVEHRVTIMASLAAIRALFEGQQYVEADHWSAAVLTVANELLEPGDPVRHSAMHWRALVLVRVGGPGAAIDLCTSLLEMPVASGDRASYLNTLGDACRVAGRYAESEKHLLAASELQQTQNGDVHPSTLQNLAYLFQETRRHDRAEEFLRRALAAKRAVLPEHDPEVIRTVAALVRLIHGTGRGKQALDVLQETYDRLRGVDIDGRVFATVAELMGELAFAIGSVETGGECYNHALDALANETGAGSSEWVRCMSNVAAQYRDWGYWADADIASRNALRAVREAVGEWSQGYAAVLNLRGIILCEIGSAKRALPFLERARDLTAATLGRHHPSYGTRLNNLALAYSDLGRENDAIPILEEALALAEEEGDTSSVYASRLHNLGVSQLQVGRLADARESLERSLELRRRHYGEDHHWSVEALPFLAAIHASLGDDETAERFLRETLDVRYRRLGQHHRDFANAVRNLAQFQIDSDPAAAVKSMAAVADLRAARIDQIFAVGSEQQRMDFLSVVSQDLDLLMTAATRTNEPEAKLILDLVLRSKGLGVEAAGSIRATLLSDRYPELQPQFERLIALQTQTARLLLETPDDGLSAEQQELVHAMESEVEDLDAFLASQIPDSGFGGHRSAGVEALANALPAGSAHVEFVLHRPYPSWRAAPDAAAPPARYVALVLQPTAPQETRLVDIAEAATVDALVHRYMSSMAGRSGRDFDAITEDIAYDEEAGHELRRLLFEPLFESPVRDPAATGQVRPRLFIAPDGELCRLPFQALPAAGGGHLLDSFRISYVGVGRDIVRFGDRLSAAGETEEVRTQTEPGPPFVLGDPDFDLAAAQVTPAPAPSGRDRQSRSLRREGRQFRRLPGSGQEAHEIARLLKVEAVTGPNALEGRLKAVRSPRILHLATHGFFLPEAGAGRRKPRRPLRARLGEGLENPLLRVGLALAGANRSLRGQPLPVEAEDGIFNGIDVAALDLLGTRLVVLSACETGLGDIRAGEGVFGLGRAFAVAGASALVLSLWRVADDTTRDLMISFYRRMIGGEDLFDALLGAQEEIRKRDGDSMEWAAFVLYGDPGPLNRSDRTPINRRSSP